MKTQKGQSRRTLSQESQVFTHFEEISVGGFGSKRKCCWSYVLVFEGSLFSNVLMAA